MSLRARPMPRRKLQVPAKKTVIKPKPGTVAKPSSPGSFADDGFARARQINAQRDREREQRQNMPFEFKIKPGEGGEKGVPVILLDPKPHFCYMHRWGFDEGQNHVEVCIQDSSEACPLCKQLNKPGTWEMHLTCLDLRPYTPERGPNAGKTIQRSRKLFVVKTKMMPKYERLFKQTKSFKGMLIRVFRDGKLDAGTGSDVQFVKMLTREELVKYARNDTGLLQLIDYDKAFPHASAKELKARWGGGGGGAVGDEAVDDDEIPF